jgi:hypothetical protein
LRYVSRLLFAPALAIHFDPLSTEAFMVRAFLGVLALCLAACTNAASPADGESTDALETAQRTSVDTNVGTIWLQQSGNDWTCCGAGNAYY